MAITNVESVGVLEALYLREVGKKEGLLGPGHPTGPGSVLPPHKTEGLEEVSHTRITREAQAIGRLGFHPHIVTGDHGNPAIHGHRVDGWW